MQDTTAANDTPRQTPARERVGRVLGRERWYSRGVETVEREGAAREKDDERR